MDGGSGLTAMSNYRGNSEQCPSCGGTYGRFRTGMRYCEVYAMLIDNHEDTRLWKYKRRRTILGKWHQIKRELWRYHVDVECVRQKQYDEAAQRGEIADDGYIRGDAWESGSDAAVDGIPF